ncbi:hypothetical protein PENSPDRAFT_594636, partial [Peniophora sp. CONT]
MLSPFWARELAHAGRDLSPVSLEDVSKQEMDAFLSMLYPSAAKDRDSKTVTDWSAILRLATMWQFQEQRELAIAALESLASPLEKLVLARAHGVEPWLHPAFVALCMRRTTLSLQEAATLSLQDTLHIMAAREAL